MIAVWKRSEILQIRTPPVATCPAQCRIIVPFAIRKAETADNMINSKHWMNSIWSIFVKTLFYRPCSSDAMFHFVNIILFYSLFYCIRRLENRFLFCHVLQFYLLLIWAFFSYVIEYTCVCAGRKANYYGSVVRLLRWNGGSWRRNLED